MAATFLQVVNVRGFPTLRTPHLVACSPLGDHALDGNLLCHVCSGNTGIFKAKSHHLLCTLCPQYFHMFWYLIFKTFLWGYYFFIPILEMGLRDSDLFLKSHSWGVELGEGRQCPTLSPGSLLQFTNEEKEVQRWQRTCPEAYQQVSDRAQTRSLVHRIPVHLLLHFPAHTCYCPALVLGKENKFHMKLFKNIQALP